MVDAQMADADDVLIRRDGGLGLITLNRPAALNAITLPMVRAMRDALMAWRDDDAIRAVVLDGAGERGLCAGGDIVAVYHSLIEGTPDAEDYWRAEYDLVEIIADYPKPYIALMDGLVLGGGVGVAAHGSLRIVTPRSRVGLTQLNIGFVPDIGGSWLAARAPGQLGTFAALTAAQLGAEDAILCGWADACVSVESLPELVADIARAVAEEPAAAPHPVAPPSADPAAGRTHSGGARSGDPNGRTELDGRTELESRAALDARLLDAARLHAVPPDAGILGRDRHWIDIAFAQDDARSIIADLQGRDEPDARAAGARLAALSPSSLAEALRLIRGASSLTLHDAAGAELIAALRVAHGPDLREGIRAQVIDKDRAPRWSPT